MARMICKASPSIVLPLALRAIGASNNSTTLNRTISAPRQQRDESLHQSHSFSSAATDKDLMDASLYKLLKREMKSVKFNLNNSQVNNLSDSFPYKIVDKEGHSNRFLVLERKFLDDDVETITVIINMRDFDRKEFDEINSSDYDSTKKDINVPAIPMIVRLGKLGGTDDHLQFKITVSTKGIVIQSFYICDRYDDFEDENNDYYDEFIYLGLEGPKFEELDSELQQSLYKYLEIRGIKSNIVGFLLKHIAIYNHKYNLLALKDFTEFFEN